MSAVAALLAQLAADGLALRAEEEALVVSPAEKLTPELRSLLVQFKPDVLELLRIHGPNLLTLFADAPTWPPVRGRSGPVAGDWWRVVGGPVRLRDGRPGRLRALNYDTRTGRLRCYVEPEGAKGGLFDPEDVDALPAVVATVGEGKRA